MFRRLLRACLSSAPLAFCGVLLLSLASLVWEFQARDAITGTRAKGKSAMTKAGKESLRQGVNPQGVNPQTAQPRVTLWGDSDHDGIPDAAELRSPLDRENFRRWLTAIAEIQFYSMSDEWSVEQRDCAGLLRFSWREALRRHDRQWFQRMGQGYEPFAPDVESYASQSIPLGGKLFRTNSKGFEKSDVEDGGFSEFADARSLKEFNSVFVSRDRKDARPGDLLFFFQPWVQKLPYHVMIFLGEALNNSEGARDWVVYHTGASGTDAGVVKKVRLSVLDHHPDKRWRPVESNRNFLGFYRLKILD
jgi:uncharacterized protein YfaT (DUF1175 family)